MRKYIALVSFILLAVTLSGCSLVSDITPPPGSEQQPPQLSTPSVSQNAVYPIVPPDLADGEKIYTEDCAGCHGDQGMGDGPQAAQLSVSVATLGLSDFARLYSPADWYTIVTQGNMEQFMPAFANLTDRQRWDVVSYAMNLGVQDEQIAQGKILYQGNCVTCHGLAGKGNGVDAASLTNPTPDLTQQSLMAQRSATSLYQSISAGISPDMPAFSDKLDENARWSLVSYLRSLTYFTQLASINPYPAPLTTQAGTTSTVVYPAPESYPPPVINQSPLVSPTAEISPTTPFTGSVAVQLINGSGGSTPSDVPVTLYGFDDMQNTYSATITSGVNGLYTFKDVRMPEGRAFIAGVDYASSSYGSDIATVNSATPDLKLQITVYDTTTDLSALSTERVHILFDFSQPQTAQVVEVFIISNPSKQAVVSSNQDHSVVTFPLPAGYTNLQFQDGELGGRYLAVKQGFADTYTVTPGVGSYTVVFAFQMPYDRKLVFDQPMSLPTGAVVVMVPDNGVKVTADQLQDGGTIDYQGITYHKYNGSGLIAGSSIQFTLAGNPNTSSTTTLFSTGNMQSLAIGLGVFGVALVLAGFWAYRRNQIRLAAQRSSGSASFTAGGADLAETHEDEDTLMDAIIALDDQYNAGNLPEEAYMERRAILKSKLRSLDRG